MCGKIMSERSKIWRLILTGWHLLERDINLDFALALVVLGITLK